MTNAARTGGSYPAANNVGWWPLTRGNSDAAGARRLTCADAPHKRRPRKVTSGPHPAKSSSGKLFRNDTTILYSLSSHSLKQWGQLGEILGGVRFPEGGASRWLVQPPMIREVVSNRISRDKKHKCGGSCTIPGYNYSSDQWTVPAALITELGACAVVPSVVLSYRILCYRGITQ